MNREKSRGGQKVD